MTDAITFGAGGIKCDNTVCGYKEDEVAMLDYPEWLNRPCPDCGENLLTQADFDMVLMMVELTGVINALDLPDDGQHYNMELGSNGSGMLSINSMKKAENKDG